MGIHIPCLLNLEVLFNTFCACPLVYNGPINGIQLHKDKTFQKSSIPAAVSWSLGRTNQCVRRAAAGVPCVNISRSSAFRQQRRARFPSMCPSRRVCAARVRVPPPALFLSLSIRIVC